MSLEAELLTVERRKGEREREEAIRTRGGWGKGERDGRWLS